MHEDEDEAKAGCYEVEAENFGLEATLASGLNIPGCLVTSAKPRRMIMMALIGATMQIRVYSI